MNKFKIGDKVQYQDKDCSEYTVRYISNCGEYIMLRLANHPSQIAGKTLLKLS